MQVHFWKPLKSIIKIYGHPRLGIVLGVFGCLVTMPFFGMMWSVVGALPGYLVCSYLAKVLHDGKAQRLIRWFFPTNQKEHAPDSKTKLFF
jgi:hypothetical protein